MLLLHEEVRLLIHDVAYAAVSSGSMAFLATGIDSVFDFGSNILLFWLHRKASRLDVNKWPVGGSRLENIGNIVYGMCTPPMVFRWPDIDWWVKHTASMYISLFRLGNNSDLEHSMAMLNCIVIVESIRKLVTKEGNELQKFHLPSLVAVSVALGKLFAFLKGFIGLILRNSR